MTESPSTGRTVFGKAALVVGAVVLFVLFSALLEKDPLPVGSAAPDLAVPQVNGDDAVLQLSNYRGKTVVADFWSTSCPPCLMQIPVLEALQKDYAHKGVAVIGVAVGGESPAMLKGWAARRNIRYPLGADVRGVAAASWQVTTLPTLFIVTPEGRIAASHVGFWEDGDLRDALEEALQP